MMVSTLLNGCRPRSAPANAGAGLPSKAVSQTSDTCRECHATAHAQWRDSDHAWANRRLSLELDRAAFTPPDPNSAAGKHLEVSWSEEGPFVRLPHEGDALFQPDLVLGHKPLRQFLVPQEGGRWQPLDWAWDPARGDWFYVFGEDRRHPGEWGHWTGRGMNWNSMCAHCHMTGYRKNYDAGSDSYRSTWVEHGVGCIQCHGPMPPGHDRLKHGAVLADSAQETWSRDRSRMMHTCAYCHARNEPLTEEFIPGDNYHDHYRVVLPVDPAVFYPDGQQLDEDFNWTSVLLSRMHHAGVTCLDCHNPHSTETLLPVENNALCLQCHGAPGRIMPGTGVGATVIDPVAHSRHQEGSTGSQCVTCHMPTTTYMARAPRHDHGWLIPDPLLTKELGIPNACNRCHLNETVEWAIEKTEEWYGDRMETRQRERTRAVAALQRGEGAAVDAVLGLLREEDIPAWQATYLQLLAPWSGRADVTAAAKAALDQASPLVRSSAVQVLAGSSSTREALRPLLNDPVRLVRLDAAWVLADELDPTSPAARELNHYLQLSADQPTGQLRLGQFLANTSRLSEADAAIAKAAKWDPLSAPIFETRAIVLQMLNRPADAAAAFLRAADLQPQNGEAMFRAALAFAEAGQLQEAEAALQRAVQRQPNLHRAWYNRGLLLAQWDRLAESASALRQAEVLAPSEADYPFALATVLLRQGDRTGARAAVERALAANPQHPSARAMLRQLGGR